MTTEQSAPQDATPIIEAGTLLKNRRLELGLSQKQVADKLRLRVAVVEQLESNHYQGDLVATFTRGYARSYAKLVGLDEQVILDALDNVSEAQHQDQEMQSFSRKTSQEQHNSRIMWVTWVILLVIIGISSVWWWQNQQDNSLNLAVSENQQTPSDQTAAPLVSEDILMVEPAAEESTSIEVSEPETVDSVTEIASASSPIESVTAEQPVLALETPTQEIVPEATPVAVVQSATEDTSPKTIDGLPVIKMSFKADCWVQVKDANGRVLIEGLKKAGQSEEFNGKAPLKVILGAPEGVQMTFASEPVDLSGYTAGKVARFTLP